MILPWLDALTDSYFLMAHQSSQKKMPQSGAQNEVEQVITKLRGIVDSEIAASQQSLHVLGQLEFLAENAHLIVSADE